MRHESTDNIGPDSYSGLVERHQGYAIFRALEISLFCDDSGTSARLVSSVFWICTPESLGISALSPIRFRLPAFMAHVSPQQLYVRGELVGGLDIVQEMKAEGPLASQLQLPTKVPLAVMYRLCSNVSIGHTRSRSSLRGGCLGSPANPSRGGEIQAFALGWSALIGSGCHVS